MKSRPFKSFLAIASLLFALIFSSCGENNSKLEKAHNSKLEKLELRIISFIKAKKNSFENVKVLMIEETTDPNSFVAAVTFYDSYTEIEVMHRSVYTFNVSLDYVKYEDRIFTGAKSGEEWLLLEEWLKLPSSEYKIKEVALRKVQGANEQFFRLSAAKDVVRKWVN